MVCGAPCLRSDPPLGPQRAPFQPAAPAIGFLELIHPAEPCKAPFVPSCRLDQAGDRHARSRLAITFTACGAVGIQAQAPAPGRAKPPSN